MGLLSKGLGVLVAGAASLGVLGQQFMRGRCRDQKDIVDYLQSEHNIHLSENTERALRRVDRADYVPRPYDPYHDAPKPIGYNATISAPHMHAFCLELLSQHLKPGARVLDVGSGSGYLTAVMAHMVANPYASMCSPFQGHVVGVEHIADLVELSIRNMRKSPSTARLIDCNLIEVIAEDGRSGYAIGGPYDAIHVGAAANEVPNALLNQLAIGGRLIIPVGEPKRQRILVVDKEEDGTISTRYSIPVRYVPLTSQRDQLNKEKGMI